VALFEKIVALFEKIVAIFEKIVALFEKIVALFFQKAPLFGKRSCPCVPFALFSTPRDSLAAKANQGKCRDRLLIKVNVRQNQSLFYHV